MEVQKENAVANNRAPKALNTGELKMMLGQCLKMASENKITSSNTWGLPLIEHLDSLIKEDDVEKSTNFQKASVTLDAGVKIYSYRVDSVHTETFKILGGLGRASGPGEETGDPGEGGVDGENVSPSKRKRRNNELNPEATLEPNLDALNVKKFDLAFAVDPLFHKTSAQFDEGGARGLLLNNLSVYKGCEIVFDSMDVPERALDGVMGQPASADSRIDLSAVQSYLDAVKTGSQKASASRISPALDEILGLLGGGRADEQAIEEADAFVQQIADNAGDVRPMRPISTFTAAAAPSTEHQVDTNTTNEMPTEAADNGDAYIAPYDDDDYGGGFDGGYDSDGGNNNEGFAAHAGRRLSAMDVNMTQGDLAEDAIQWLISAGGAGTEAGGNNNNQQYVTGAKGWAGASHWRYRSVPQSGVRTAEGEDGDQEVDGPRAGAGKKGGKGGSRKKNDPLDFVELMKGSVPKFDMMPKSKAPRKAKPVANTLLPEDHHYKPEALARYSLRPRTGISFTATERRSGSGYGGEQGGYGGGNDAGWANQDAIGFDDDFGGGDFGGGMSDDEGDAYGGGGDWDLDLGDPAAGLQLVELARKVEKVDVNYSRAAKQVDVRSLKELMWSGIQQVLAKNGGSKDTELHLHDILATVPEKNAAGRLADLSVHLCFICVLHLANEHGLVVKGVNELDNLLISNVPEA